MDERNDTDRIDEVMLPGFRFHPTDEELVGFYLKRKVQQKPLSIELIRQLDIYKYDPWELPKLAATGEKELYFYCPRDRKYRNSARPNRVTGGGFWKATGTDRPIYSSEGTKCIGLKKSLVFYEGRAARGTKTDWMMHEFRLPSLTDPSLPKRPFDRTIPAIDTWAICRIFKKANSMAQRALWQSWASSLPDTVNSDMYPVSDFAPATQFGSENILRMMRAGSMIQFGCNNGTELPAASTGHPPLDVTSYKPINLANSKPSLLPISSMEMFHPVEMSATPEFTTSVASMLRNLPPTMLRDVKNSSASIGFEQTRQCNGFTAELPVVINENLGSGEEENSMGDVSNDQWGAVKALDFPSNLLWDSTMYPSDTSTSYYTNDGFT